MIFNSLTFLPEAGEFKDTGKLCAFETLSLMKIRRLLALNIFWAMMTNYLWKFRLAQKRKILLQKR